MDTPKFTPLLPADLDVRNQTYRDTATLDAWLAQEVKCPFCFDFVVSLKRPQSWCLPCAGTGTLTLGALIQKLEAK